MFGNLDLLQPGQVRYGLNIGFGDQAGVTGK